MRVITVKVPETLANRLAVLVRKRGSSRSAIIREALESHIGASARGSSLDLARDLAGSIGAAAPDLSSNRRHMRRYGR